MKKIFPLLAGILFYRFGLAEVKITSGLYEKLARQDSVKVWIFFKDKGVNELDETALRRVTKASVSPESFRRRVKRLGNRPLFDYSDLPVSKTYLEQISDAGGRVDNVSRWLNASSVWLAGTALENLNQLPFIDSIKMVGTAKRAEPLPVKEPLFRPFQPDSFILNYGPSFDQLAQINVPVLHRMGFSGKGVKVAIFDTGFLLSHIAFDSLRLTGRILATRDFIHKDTDVVDLGDADGTAQRDHGTSTLSVLGGFASGQLIGPAFGASFLLAKTEIALAETVSVEEDNWVAALEWADSMGAEVVSSSLGYTTGVGGGYTQADMDGNTAITTIAADMAMAKGILVVNAAGNERIRPGFTWGTIIAPADGDSVLAVGAVDQTGFIANFSSPGPSADGRIKPDVCAQGVSTVSALSSFNNSFGSRSGTSFATPLVAGAAALLFEVDTLMSPFTAYSRLRSTASQASTPNNDFGYGIINAFAASGLASPLVSGGKEPIEIKVFPNPSQGRTILRIATQNHRVVKVALFSTAGEVVWRSQVETFGNMVPADLIWNGENQKGEKAASGIYFGVVKAGETEEGFKLAVIR